MGKSGKSSKEVDKMTGGELTWSLDKNVEESRKTFNNSVTELNRIINGDASTKTDTLKAAIEKYTNTYLPTSGTATPTVAPTVATEVIAAITAALNTYNTVKGKGTQGTLQAPEPAAKPSDVHKYLSDVYNLYRNEYDEAIKVYNA